MGNDEAALVRLWQEKRGEVEPEDLSNNLIVQLGVATEDLNRRWFELNTGQTIKDRQRHAVHPLVRWMAATLDGIVEAPGRCSRPSSCCPGPSPSKPRSRSTWPSCSTTCGSSTPSGGALDHHRRRPLADVKIAADPLYQHLLVTAERNFWRSVVTGEPPRLFNAEPPDRGSPRSDWSI